MAQTHEKTISFYEMKIHSEQIEIKLQSYKEKLADVQAERNKLIQTKRSIINFQELFTVMGICYLIMSFFLWPVMLLLRCCKTTRSILSALKTTLVEYLTDDDTKVETISTQASFNEEDKSK